MSGGNSKGGSRVFENEMRNILLYNIILHYISWIHLFVVSRKVRFMLEIVSGRRFISFLESRIAVKVEAFSSPSQQNAHFAIFCNVISMYVPLSHCVLLCESITCIWIIVKYLKMISKKKSREFRTYQIEWTDINSVSTSFASYGLANLSIAISYATRISFFGPCKT